MRDGFVFYRSFYDAIRELEPELRAEVYDAICEYGFTGEMPECSGVVRGFLHLVKPQIDANQRRYENGRRGGRPRKTEMAESETEAKPSKNQPETNPEPKPENPEPKEKEKVKDKEKEKEKEKVKAAKHKHGEYQHVLITDSELEKLIADFGEARTRIAIRILDEAIETHGYKYKNHYLVLRKWPIQEAEKIPEEKDPGEQARIKAEKRKALQEELDSIDLSVLSGKEWQEAKLRRSWLEDNIKRLS
jgi:hypothetical protein